MRRLLIAAALFSAACEPIEPNLDAGLQLCSDAAVALCLRGPAGSCDFEREVPAECGVIPPCGCECPAGYVPLDECGEP